MGRTSKRRYLNKAQKDYIKSLVSLNKYMLFEGEITKIEAMNFYETAHSDAHRYYIDLLLKAKYENK